MTGTAAPAPRARRWVLLGAACLHFYNLLYGFITPVLLPSIMEGYGSMRYYALLVGANALVTCVVVPVGGKLGDVYGRRRVGLVALAARIATMALCAIPTSVGFFSLAFLVSGAAGGLVGSYPIAILSDATMPQDRTRWVGILGTINGVALLVGLLGGGLITDTVGPLAAFVLFAPVGIFTWIALFRFYPGRHSEGAPRVDTGGILLLFAAVAPLIAWSNFGDVYFGRTSPTGIAVLCVGGLLCFAAVRHMQRRTDPLLDLRFFKNRSFRLSALTFFLVAPMVCLCSTTLMLYGQLGLGLSATLSGTLALPKNILFFVLPGLLGGYIGTDVGRFRRGFLACGASILAGGSICSFFTADTPLPAVYAVMLLFGLGTSLQSVCIHPYMQLAVPSGTVGSATGLVNFMSSLGTVLFNCIYSVLYNAFYLGNTGGEAAAPAAIARLFATMSGICAVAGLGIVVAALLLMPRRNPAKAIGY